MNKDLQSYVKIYKGFYDKTLCEETVEQLKHAHFVKHRFYNFTKDSTKTFDTDLSVSADRIKNYDELANKIWYALEQYIVKDFNFKWFDGWNGYCPPRFNRYDSGTEMHEHCDHIRDIFQGEIRGVPILSVLGVLNEDYVGGEFVMFQDETIELKTGDLMIFPSSFLYPHKVNPVTQGVRYSFVSWMW
jgi:hypothetical protein